MKFSFNKKDIAMQNTDYARPLQVDGKNFTFFDFNQLAADNGTSIERLPYSIRILVENLLRKFDGHVVNEADMDNIVRWQKTYDAPVEIPYHPARVLMQDFTGVPAVVDLAAMRDAMTELGGDPDRINPLQPAELVIDHSVQVDSFGSAGAMDLNSELEYQRNQERYSFLKWGQKAFSNFKVVPPDTGIVHQVNLEYLARVVFEADNEGVQQAYPDTLVGTDSHTTMVNGLGVLGWGVGGIEAEAAMLGQPISMLLPQVVGFKLTGKLREGATATDAVLTEITNEAIALVEPGRSIDITSNLYFGIGSTIVLTILLAIVVATLSHRKLQEREGRWLKLISGLVILILGVVMIIKPELMQLGH